MPGPKRLGCFGDGDELVKRSLKFPEPGENGPDFQIKKLNVQSQNWFDNRRVSETVLHHTLKTSFPQYEALPGAQQTSHVGFTSEEAPQDNKAHFQNNTQIQTDTQTEVAPAEVSDPEELISRKMVYHPLKTDYPYVANADGSHI